MLITQHAPLAPISSVPATVPRGDGRSVHVVWLPCLTAVVGSLVVLVSGVRGADYPAQLLRAELLEQSGSAVWNFYWYAGHATPSYSLVVPPLVAVFGAPAVGIGASLAATLLVGHLVQRVSRSSWWAVAAVQYFALVSTVNLVVGRTTFAVGLALAAGALLAWSADRRALTVMLGATVPLVSPVPATFLAIIAAGVIVDRWWRARAIALRSVVVALPLLVVSSLPLVVMGLANRDAGWFPFRAAWLAWSLLAMAAAAVALRERPLRVAIALAATASIVLFFVPNPLGGTFVRFAQFVVVPAALVGLETVRRMSLRVPTAAALALVAVWSVQAGVVAAVDWVDDPSVRREYHTPLINEVARRNRDGQPVGRLEIPFTRNHWETFYVASEVPFARGWERNLDRERSPELYGELSDDGYRAWIDRNAVRWVAVPDVELDEGGEPEARLMERGLPWLDLVWSNANWRLYEVADYQPVVDPPGRFVEQSPDTLTVEVPRRVAMEIRVEYSDGLEISGAACIARHAEGRIVAEFPAAGTYELTVGVDAILPGDGPADSCD